MDAMKTLWINYCAEINRYSLMHINLESKRKLSQIKRSKKLLRFFLGKNGFRMEMLKT